MTLLDKPQRPPRISREELCSLVEQTLQEAVAIVPPNANESVRDFLCAFSEGPAVLWINIEEDEASHCNQTKLGRG